MESRLVMKLCEEIISYDLESLEKDPKAIIELLKVTASERDKWIVVACHYRRKGDVEAAISVVTCMVEGNLPLHHWELSILKLIFSSSDDRTRNVRTGSEPGILDALQL